MDESEPPTTYRQPAAVAAVGNSTSAGPAVPREPSCCCLVHCVWAWERVRDAWVAGRVKGGLDYWCDVLFNLPCALLG